MSNHSDTHPVHFLLTCPVLNGKCVCARVSVQVAVRGRLAPRSHHSLSSSLSAPLLGQANCFHASLVVYLISSFTIRSLCFLDTSKDIKKRLPPLHHLHSPFSPAFFLLAITSFARVCQFVVFGDAGGVRGDKERKRSERKGDVNSPIVSVC